MRQIQMTELIWGDKNTSSPLSPHEYKEPGKYQIVVKVIDILGNDTTKTLEISVP